MSDEANTKPEFTFPDEIVTATRLPSPSALTLNQIWGNIIKPFTAIAPTDSRFVDATISLDEIGKGYTLDYNPNGILWRVNAAGIPHPDDLEKFYEQQEIIQGYSESKSNINLDKIGEYLDAYDFATNQLVSGPPLVAAAGALSKIGVKAAKGAIKVGKYIARVDEAADIAIKGSSKAVFKTIDEGINFAATPARHMENSGRFVPVQTLRETILSTKASPDPRGSLAEMHYAKIFKNGSEYNLEVLYDRATNTIYHFEYTRNAIGDLPRIIK